MSDTTDTASPDLKQGIPQTELLDGQMLVGHVDGDAVLLARRGDDIFAIDAACLNLAELGDAEQHGDCGRKAARRQAAPARLATARAVAALMSTVSVTSGA